MRRKTHFVRALQEFSMVRPGDKVLVCLSGSRESLALLHTMHQYQFYARSKGTHFSIGALFVHEDKSEVDPLHLMAYCRTLGVKFIYQDKLDDIDSERRSNSSKVAELHRWSSHATRRRAYAAARAHGYGVAAVAQSLDHAARAFLAAALHAGTLATIKAHYRIREHDIRIIRPFIYVRERALQAFARARMLPDFRAREQSPPLSPRSEDSTDETGKNQHIERSVSEPCGAKEKMAVRRSIEEIGEPLETARDLLLSQEQSHPYIFNSLKNALHPLISARNIEKDLKEHRHRKKSVIQMKNGAPVYDSEEGTEEEPVP